MMTKQQEHALVKEEVDTLNQHRKRVGILGGGFNPVHIGHLVMADQVYGQLGLDEFYLMPTYQSPHVDKKTVIDATHRVDMLTLATESSSYLNVELEEVFREGKSYTFDTMESLIAKNPNTDYYFVIGGDMVEYLPKWYRIDELVQMVQFVAIKRSGYPEVSKYPLIWVDSPRIDVSSSLIRGNIQRGCPIKYLVPDDVIDYIQKKDLYKHDN
ncbi:nicotinate-nucleotide adenylyltransferase [Vagococcus luciliae]|uniref:Probable nicotinate-nucleotide adenylyltransferase n=1 Tax=Vagococcus luciliae TaxID=2920380 RepID=A0ABY5P1L3_9ENTE|nr:nicotinate-nucleotide adenylyltransferase [Vagococcus luciliae]UUV99835.1 Nicotinate-nucleotide adenylyltransferase [Vagococcus luciliae]